MDAPSSQGTRTTREAFHRDHTVSEGPSPEDPRLSHVNMLDMVFAFFIYSAML